MPNALRITTRTDDVMASNRTPANCDAPTTPVDALLLSARELGRLLGLSVPDRLAARLVGQASATVAAGRFGSVARGRACGVDTIRLPGSQRMDVEGEDAMNRNTTPGVRRPRPGDWRCAPLLAVGDGVRRARRQKPCWLREELSEPLSGEEVDP